MDRRWQRCLIFRYPPNLKDCPPRVLQALEFLIFSQAGTYKLNIAAFVQFQTKQNAQKKTRLPSRDLQKRQLGPVPVYPKDQT